MNNKLGITDSITKFLDFLSVVQTSLFHIREKAEDTVITMSEIYERSLRANECLKKVVGEVKKQNPSMYFGYSSVSTLPIRHAFPPCDENDRLVVKGD